jgi:hypothetical protein
MSLPRSILSLLLAAFLVGAWGCASGAASSAKTKSGPPHGAEASAQPGGSGYAAKVRAALTAKHEEAAACFAKTGGARRPVSVMVSSPLYISPGAAYFPKHAAAPFMAAFERCLLAALERWPLPRPISDYEGAWLRIHLQPLEASAPRDPQRLLRAGGNARAARGQRGRSVRQAPGHPGAGAGAG